MPIFLLVWRGPARSQAGRFGEALELLDRWPDLEPTSVAAVRGSIAFAHGRLAENAELKSGRIAKYTIGQQFRVLSEVRAHVLLCRALLEVGHEHAAQQGADQAEENRQPDAIRSFLAAAAVSCAGNPDKVRQHVERSREAAEIFGHSKDTYKTILPLVFDAVIRRDEAEIAYLHAIVAAFPRRRARAWRAIGFWLESAGMPVSEPEVAWLEHVDVIRSRWNELITKRRADLGLG